MNERIGYKVVTQDMRSLGLRRNPNILTYPQGIWYRLADDWVVEGSGDWGGIWIAKKKSGARTLQKYMLDHYGQHVRVFVTNMDRILYENSYRIKTNAVLLFEEIT